MADREEGQQVERAHGNHAKSSSTRQGNLVHGHDPMHGNHAEPRSTRHSNYDRVSTGDQPGTSGVSVAAVMGGGAPPTSDGPVLDRMMGLLHSLSDRLTALENGKTAEFFSAESDYSDNDSACAENQTDELGRFLESGFAPALDSDGDSNAFAESLSALGAMFDSGSDVGKPIHETLAPVLNAALRRKPVEEQVQKLVAKHKIPANMTTPRLNQELFEVMNKEGKFRDIALQRCVGLVTKALIPLSGIISDVGSKTTKPVEHYLPQLNDALQLLTASVNYMNHARKDGIRASIRHLPMNKICSWETEVGTDVVFPFDVVKKLEDLKKAKKLTSTSTPSKKFGHSVGRWPRSRFGQSRPFFPYTRQPSRQGSSTRKAPFLGKGPQYPQNRRIPEHK